MRIPTAVLLAPALLLLTPLPAWSGEGAGARAEEAPETDTGVVGHGDDCERRVEALQRRLTALEQASTAGGEAGAPEDVAGWGETRWGMDASALKEKLPGLAGTGPVFHLQREIADRPARVELQVGGQGLETVVLHFFPDGGTPSAGDFGELRRLLTRKYGPPDEENVSWNGSQAPPNQAVASGRLALKATWYRGPTRIDLSLAGRGGVPVLVVRYEKEKGPPPEEAPTADELEGL